MQFKSFAAAASVLAFVGAQDTSSILSAVPSAVSSAASGASSGASSAAAGGGIIPSASSSASAAAPSGSAAPSYEFTCPEGLLTYYLSVQEYTGVNLTEATTYFSNWTYAVVGELVNNTGSGEVGAMRTYTLAGANISEELVSVNSSSTTGSLQQIWNSTAPVMIGDVTVYNFTDSLNVYTNTSTMETNVQLFINACLNNQTSGLALLAQAVDAELSGWYSMLSGNSTSASPSGSASAMASGSAAPSTIVEASGSGAVSSGLAPTPMMSASASAAA